MITCMPVCSESSRVQVVGIDFSGRFIDAAMKIQGGKVLQCGSQQVAKLPSQTDPSRVHFKQVIIYLCVIP